MAESIQADSVTESRVATPLVFISHDHRDAALAEAFVNLLSDASGGSITCFRSSDTTGGGGIDYGTNWYPVIMNALSNSEHVIALLTPHSINRPWLLYEAGMGHGKRGAKVIGVAFGVPLADATSGPFAQFQNVEAKEEGLTGLLLQLIRAYNVAAKPREPAVKRDVEAFLTEVKTKALVQPSSTATAKETSETLVAKAFEEVKVMFEDVRKRLMILEHNRAIPLIGRATTIKGSAPNATSSLARSAISKGVSLEALNTLLEVVQTGSEGVVNSENFWDVLRISFPFRSELRRALEKKLPTTDKEKIAFLDIFYRKVEKRLPVYAFTDESAKVAIQLIQEMRSAVSKKKKSTKQGK